MIMGREVTSFCFFVLGLVIACPSNPGTADQSKCGEGRFLCSSDQKCIGKTWVCDGTPDCKDGSDETTPECKGLNQTEGPNQTEDCKDKYMCKWGTPKCIDKSKVCDDKRDCTDFTDEKQKDCWNEKIACPAGPEAPEGWVEEFYRTDLCAGKESACDNGFDNPENCYTDCYNNKCYHLGNEELTFEESISYCKKKKGYLVEINDQKENDLIWNLLKKMFIERRRFLEGKLEDILPPGYKIWLGLAKHCDETDDYETEINEETKWRWIHSNQTLDYDNFRKKNNLETCHGYYIYDAATMGYGSEIPAIYYGTWERVKVEDPINYSKNMASVLCEWEL